MYIKAKGGVGGLLEMFFFLHMIVVCAKASWLNRKLEFFFSNSKHSVTSSYMSVNHGGSELCKAVSE